MEIKNSSVKKLLTWYKEVNLLGEIQALLSWDSEVNLPPMAATGRGKQMGYLAEKSASLWQTKEFEKLLGEAMDGVGSMNVWEKAIVRNIERGANFYLKVPKETIVEFSETTSIAYPAWVKAKDEGNFKLFLPHLVKIIELNRRVAEFVGYRKHPYDALLDMYEPNLTKAKLDTVFSQITPFLVATVKAIEGSKVYKSQLADNPFADISFPIHKQKRLTKKLLDLIGYNFQRGRVDISSHPFSTNPGAFDSRITTRYLKNNLFECISTALHEGGHALYEMGVNPDYFETPIAGGASLGIHESQSRFWENVVGKSNEFTRDLFVILTEIFPEEMAKLTVEDLVKALNKVERGAIRVGADEVTYNLHIALRFEIESALISGEVRPASIPELWNSKMQEYLGITPSKEAQGCLQDVHWAHGTFGYFPTYTLGNLYSAQFTNKMQQDIGLGGRASKEDLKRVLGWLRSKIHVHGSLYLPEDLCKEVTGEGLNPDYYKSYIKNKYSDIYKINIE